ncbi:MAG: hypothetical protein KC492_11580 [Myxococcales bacterium]|nr:hypothetical protein [Myxococcales bacterium]
MLALAALGTIAGVASYLVAEDSFQSQLGRDQRDVQTEILQVIEKIKDRLARLQLLLQRIIEFINATAPDPGKIPDALFAFGSVSLHLNPDSLAMKHSLQAELIDLSRELNDLDAQLLTLLPAAGVDITHETQERSQVFREALRTLTGGGVSFGVGLSRLGDAIEYARDMTNAIANMLGPGTGSAPMIEA